MTKELKYDIFKFTKGEIKPSTPRDLRMEILAEVINPEKYKFVGFEKGGSILVLLPRFHNVRDRNGRFAARKRK
jgi:hypothetical protein